ncbi:hypothetical protein Q31b_36910 [Novipirellula aureliae]|uniref:Uncharacterized protein n=1 Tax=Novipirellula aureliae TaxID=2527966 RepID=A0A5C6DUG6_9BACT|nr:hypothetical protein [Novipirellula aureliae]TWU40342.1 hypothetical protein Q31b_36910 [Novipirellula aureliae]
MRGFLTAIAILALILVLSAWAGWWTVESNDDSTNVRIDKTEIQSDTERITDGAKRLANDVVEQVDRPASEEVAREEVAGDEPARDQPARDQPARDEPASEELETDKAVDP